MNYPFPFALPWPTAFYLILYVLTFALHQAFMHYVLAGSLYVAWATMFPAHQPGAVSVPRNQQPLALILRDWMPFLLSAAITAGVAPLLFIQIVYQREFYTANLLLSWRWMIVVPVLIAAFYMLYLIKSSILSRWPQAVRSAVVVVTAGCFVFVGFCWSANHLLGMSESQWAEVYITGRLPFLVLEMASRMLIWIGGSFATMAAITGWQLLYSQSLRRDSNGDESRRLATMSITGLGVMLLAAIASLAQANQTTRQVVFSGATVPYLLLFLAGIGMQVSGWILQMRRNQLDSKLLAVNSAGAVLTLLGICFIREAIRANAVDMSALVEKHANAARVGGFGVFLIFTVLVTSAIAWCFWIVRQGWTQGEQDV